MKSVLHRFLVLLMLMASAGSQSNFPKYSVLKTKGGDAYLATLNQLADQGYRVLVVGEYTVLRLEATPPDTYRYVRLEDTRVTWRHILFVLKGGPAQFSNSINELGARGYRWLPGTDLLEKTPHPKNYEYRNSQHGNWGASKNHELSSVLEAGYRPVGVVAFTHAIGHDTAEMYFERQVGARDSAPQHSSGTIEIADARRADNLMKRVGELAKQGYRFLSFVPVGAGTDVDSAVMMERCPTGCAGRYEYRRFDAKNAAQIERELNALGNDAFRIIAATLSRPPHLLERDVEEKRTYSYHALAASDAAALQQLLNSADQAGYAPVDFVWHSGFSSAQPFLITEKGTTASSAP